MYFSLRHRVNRVVPSQSKGSDSKDLIKSSVKVGFLRPVEKVSQIVTMKVFPPTMMHFPEVHDLTSSVVLLK